MENPHIPAIEGGVSRQARIIQALWLLLAVATTALYAVPVATQWVDLNTICRPVSACAPFQLDVASARTLSQHGISMGMFAIFTAAVWAAGWVIWYGLGALIIWRKPQDRGAVLSAFFLVTFLLLVSSLAGFIPTSSLADLQPILWIVPFSALLLFGLLFPDGHFAPRWTRWLAVSGILVTIASSGQDSVLSVIPVLLFPITIVCVQTYRFRRVSTWAQRQQTKWALSGLVVGILGFFALIFTTFKFGSAQNQDGSLFGGFTGALGVGSISIIPVFLGIAVLRSRLWDIDRIISRALLYITLSVTLGAIYIGSVVGLQALIRVVAGGSSTLAIAVSTLAIAALFGPLRRRIQIAIDRRFYRHKYDAALTLAAFTSHLRDEVDLGHLQDALVSVVNETMQPAHVSLWLPGASREVGS